MDVPSLPRSIPFLLLYYTPVVVGAYRRTQGKGRSAPPWILFLICAFTGWTVIGWLYALRLAFLDWEMPWENFRSGGGTFTPATGWDQPAAVPDEPHSCGSCGGSGTTYCTWCQGRGTWWESDPSGAAGPGIQMHCQSCSFGKATCSSCGGSGTARW